MRYNNFSIGKLILKPGCLLLVNILIISIIVFQANAQIAGWRLYSDKTGNTFFIDRNWKIYTNKPAQNESSSVNLANVTYKINRADQLLRSHNPVAAIQIYQSILIMNANNFALQQAKTRASKKINFLLSMHGARYQQYEKKALPFLYSINDRTIVTNPHMRFKLTTRYTVSIVKRRNKQDYKYRYRGLVCGLTTRATPKNKFNILVAVDAEQLPYTIHNLLQLQHKWQKNIFSNNVKKQLLRQSLSSIFYSFTTTAKTGFSGYEGIVFKNNFAYYIRIICNSKIFNSNKKEMLFIINNFKII